MTGRRPYQVFPPSKLGVDKYLVGFFFGAIAAFVLVMVAH